jgi:hypothetical protein
MYPGPVVNGTRKPGRLERSGGGVRAGAPNNCPTRKKARSSRMANRAPSGGVWAARRIATRPGVSSGERDSSVRAKKIPMARPISLRPAIAATRVCRDINTIPAAALVPRTFLEKVRTVSYPRCGTRSSRCRRSVADGPAIGRRNRTPPPIQFRALLRGCTPPNRCVARNE